MRFLERNKHYKKNEPTQDAKKIYLSCEGEKTEIKYFSFFVKFSENVEIITIPPKESRSDPLKLMENSKLLFLGDEKKQISPIYELNKEYGDVIWFVIDTDEWNKGNKIEKLRSFCAENNIEGETWHVAQSNPSFEQWQYYHFYGERPDNKEVGRHDSFKDFLSKKIVGGFDNRKHPLNIDIAIDNSQRNFTMVDNQPALYCTELHILGNLILNLIKDDLVIAKRIAGS